MIIPYLEWKYNDSFRELIYKIALCKLKCKIEYDNFNISNKNIKY